MLEARLPHSAESAKVDNGWHRATAKSSALLTSPQSSMSPAYLLLVWGFYSCWRNIGLEMIVRMCLALVQEERIQARTPKEYPKMLPSAASQLPPGWCKYCPVNCLGENPWEDAASVLGLTDPRLCYVLDGFLFIYAVIMTALFVKAKLSQASEPQLRAGQDDVYNKLSRGHRDDYDVLGGKRGADPELGGRHQQRRKNPQDTVYTSLQKDKMGEAYSEIGMKGEQRRRGKGNEGLYQGLSAATKDTYDALQMQPLPPR
ncbi:T-cell surface glycoprotein CD3 zeta chain isoform X2 [Passer domesticus]|uniref:T-cell surface glycoprotein CD3 zeta chain isoform X2 n=1 Tax=Passer domesticus TaxID=48849 RepID=UPI0030FE2905